MATCNPYNTLYGSTSKLFVDGKTIPDPTLYRSLVNALLYPTFTRPDIAYTIQKNLPLHELIA